MPLGPDRVTRRRSRVGEGGVVRARDQDFRAVEGFHAVAGDGALVDAVDEPALQAVDGAGSVAGRGRMREGGVLGGWRGGVGGL